MQYTFHRRFYYQLNEIIKKKVVTFLLGPRKCGKTVALRQLAEESSNAVYIDFKTLRTDEDKFRVFDAVIADLVNDKDRLYLLDEVTYVSFIESEISRVASELAGIEHTKTRVVFTGSQSVALSTWASRAFCGTAGVIRADFLSYPEFLDWRGLSEVSEETYNRFLHEVSEFYQFQSLEEYITGCINETIISNANTSNYIMNNECYLIAEKADVLVNICYQTLFTLHNHVSSETFFKKDKMHSSLFYYFREVCAKLGETVLADRIFESFIASYNVLKKQDVKMLVQAFIFLYKCGLVTITPVVDDYEVLPDVLRDLNLLSAKGGNAEELFSKYNITINYPMFYVGILQDILKSDLPDKLPETLLGSIIECHARGLLHKGIEYSVDVDDVVREIDYVDISSCMAVEFTVSNRHKNNFNLLPDYMHCTLLTKDKYYTEGNLEYVPYYEYIYKLSEGRNSTQKDRDLSLVEKGLKLL